MRISDWSSDVCSSDLLGHRGVARPSARFVVRRNEAQREIVETPGMACEQRLDPDRLARAPEDRADQPARQMHRGDDRLAEIGRILRLLAIDRVEQAGRAPASQRSEEHTSELQSLMRHSYAVFCLKKKNHISNSVLT